MPLINEIFGASPGITTQSDATENEIMWGDRAFRAHWIRSNALISGAARDAGASPTTVLRAGLLLGQIRSSQLLKEWTPAATDGSEEIAGVLLHPVNTQRMSADQNRLLGFVAWGGPVKAARLIIPGASSTEGLAGKALEFYVRGTMGGRFQFDDAFHQWQPAGPLGWKKIAHKTADYTVVTADDGTLFTNLGATAAVNFTLPAVASSQGLRFGFFSASVTAGATLTVTSSPADSLITFNDIAADSVALSTASELAGGMFELIGLDNSKWAVIAHLSGNGATVQDMTVVS